jgi:N-acetyltransferase
VSSVVDLQVRLEGRLVVLEPLAAEHEDGLFEAAQDGELFTWLPVDPGASRAAMRRWLTASVEAARLGKEAPFAILDASTAVPVGSTRFHEIRLDVGARRVEFKTDARNARSRGALEALGAQFEGVLRKHMVVAAGAPRDSAYYSVIDDEWPDVKAVLERRLERQLAARTVCSPATNRSTSSTVL